MQFCIHSKSHGSVSNAEKNPADFVYTVSDTRRLLPSTTEPNSYEQDCSQCSLFHPRYSKFFDYELVITDKKHFKCFLTISLSVVLLILALVLLVHFLPRKHGHSGSSKNLTLAVNLALTFFDAQKSGHYPKNGAVKFRGESGLNDGNYGSLEADLVGGFYDSGNNIKFSFPTAYTVTLLSWSVIEYHQKYSEIGELNHVKDIIRWGTDYLLKLFVPSSNATSDRSILYSQVGVAGNDSTPGDIYCWERPEDMDYSRPISSCDASSATDLAGEVVAALSAASLVFNDDNDYSRKLVQTAEKLFELASQNDPAKQATYTSIEGCGKEAINFYNSSGYLDELVWGGAWLFFATGNTSHLAFATDLFNASLSNETSLDNGIFYWNNKLIANAVLLTRLRFFQDPGFPYESALAQSAKMVDSVVCSYIYSGKFCKTPGGLILQRPNSGEQLQFAVTASFLSKLYSDYLNSLLRSGGTCGDYKFSLQMLRNFSESQVNYILGDNAMKLSYVVGFGQHYPNQVHHRSASIPWADGQHYSCKDGEKWLNSNGPNPNTLLGAMVAGPDQFDKFEDKRDKPWFTQPTISSNAGLVAALIALHDPPTQPRASSDDTNSGIDILGLFRNIQLIPGAR